MTQFDDELPKPPGEDIEIRISDPSTVSSSETPQSVAPPPGDPLWATVKVAVPYAQRTEVPEDLRISWSWVHLICFIGFAVVSLIVVQTGMAIRYAPHQRLTQKELEQYLFSIPQFIVGSNLMWFGVVLLFLYVSLAVLPNTPFWKTLGWRRFSATPEAFHSNLPTKPWIYFGAGCALSLLAAIAGSRVHTPDNMPIEQLLKSRVGAMLMMGMAVLVAPLVEETVFRGYLYPVLVRLISGYYGFVAESYWRANLFSLLLSAAIGSLEFRFLHRMQLALSTGLILLVLSLILNYLVFHFVGEDAVRGIRSGIFSSILVTGLLFGMLHGAQLAWTWGIVTLLIFVGITFTYVRARTGTVYASYLMHLGYNSLIAFATIVSTHGFTRMPPHP